MLFLLVDSPRSVLEGCRLVYATQVRQCAKSWAGWWIAGVRDPSDSNRRLKESERLFLLLGHEDPACAM